MIKRYFKVAAVLAVIMSGACGQSKPPAMAVKNPTKSDTFRIAMSANDPFFPRNAPPFYLHPHYFLGPATCFTHETLVDQTGEFGLAKSITISTDGKDAIVELSKGVMFHDGAELTADDVIFSFDSLRKANRDKNKAVMAVISNPIIDCDTEKLDSHKVAIRAKFPIDYMNALEKIEIINGESRKIFKNNGQPISAPNGTGPYQIKGVDAERDTITLTANPAYRLGAPRIKKIEITLFKSMDAASMAVLTNKADYTHYFKKNG